MTETVNPAPAENTEAEAPKLDRSKLSEMASMILGRVEPDFKRVQEIAAEQNKTGDVGQLLSEAIEKSTDKKVVALRAKVEEASAFILEAKKSMEAAVKPTLNLPTDEELAKLDTEYKEAANRIATYNGVFEQETEQSGEKHSVYDYLGALPGKKRGAKAGQGAGTSRPRVQKIEITTDLKGEEGYKAVEKDGKSTFGILANFVKSATDGQVDLPAGDFHEAWVTQNGGKDWQDLPDVSSFVVQAEGQNGKRFDWHVRVTK